MNDAGAPVRAFKVLCLTCFTPDRVESATVDGKTIRSCAACGAVAIEPDEVERWRPEGKPPRRDDGTRPTIGGSA